MRIDRIAELRTCTVLRDFHWPSDLPNFARYNLIYGWNGSGKTTLSRVFRALEDRVSPPPSWQAVLVADGQSMKGEEFAQATTAIRVFNRDFVDESVFPTSGGVVPPILVLGKESVEKQKELDRLKGEREQEEARCATARSATQEAKRNLDHFSIGRAKAIKDALRSSGENPYNNYDKSHFGARAEQLAADAKAAAHRLSDVERDSLLVQLRVTHRPKIQTLSYRFPELGPVRATVVALLSETVVAATIDELKRDSELATWTRQGLGLHRDRQAATCLFCEGALPSKRLEALEAHFSAAYEEFMARLTGQIEDLRAASRAAREVIPPNRAELYDDLQKEYGPAEGALRSALDATAGYLDVLTQDLVAKAAKAFQPLALETPAVVVDTHAIDRLNAILGKHNGACDGFKERVNEARTRLETDSVVEAMAEFEKLRSAVASAERDVNATDKAIQELGNRILELEREILDHLPPAEELNDDLRAYLGHGELRLEVKGTGYAVSRNGVPADALSEGERTAVALLYFLKSLEDRRFDFKKGVVVLDDPVSSLDANSLYLAFGFIQARTKEAGQLLVLTHNFAFFRQVRNWFLHLKNQGSRDINKRPARFYMLECTCDNGQRCSGLKPLDDLLERYESEYQYLFSRVYKRATDSVAHPLEENYIFPNIARRLLEAFLTFRQPDVSRNLWEKLESTGFDESKRLRMIRFLDAHSHGDAVGEPEHDVSTLAETGQVLRDVTDLMKSEDPKHFDAMLKAMNATQSGDDDE